ncbi:DUF4190 domain-containing protein [Micromonospora endolithica]|uniref:DUF4190 domain-containing protein n=1 Tax=Micromonospora endolithica TaxID=230091 RepID=A0A3A9Z6B5_9ACTN|nr:DUF4190 domain-containing protein [Micromonospora endolithica]RKN43569.1 DUF4190 domain-containing protein [Micromonospora endolithica]TWJ24170.1 uncharacterized protein DUF4190 [Micromonospora endolithica]
MSQPPQPPGPTDPAEPDRTPSPWEQPAAGPEPPGHHQPSGYDQQPPSYGQHPGHDPYGPPPHEQPQGQWGQQAPYAPQPPYGQYGPPSGPGRPGGGTNVLAILSLVFAFLFAPAGIVLGHLAKRQIRTTGEDGEQLATWGTILGYVFTGLGLLVCCGWIALVAVAGTDVGRN